MFHISPDKKYELSLSDKIVHRLLLSMVVMQALGPTSIFSRLMIVEPCTPPYLGSIFLDCEGCGVLANHEKWSFLRFIFPIVDYHQILCILVGGFFYFFFVYLVSIHCLLRYSEIMTDTKYLQLVTYRKMEILERLVNDYGRVRILPMALTMAPIIEIMSMFAVIRMRAEIPFPGFLIFPIRFFATFSGLVALQTLAGKLRMTSENLLFSWRRRCGKSKYYRRKVKSMQPLTVKFASNFVDRETTLVTQNFCVAQTVSLLMLKSN